MNFLHKYTKYRLYTNHKFCYDLCKILVLSDGSKNLSNNMANRLNIWS